MTADPSNLSPELVASIRSQLLSGISALQVFAELWEKVPDHDLFVAYITTALMEEDFAWTAASRWPRGDISAYAVEKLIALAIEKNRHLLI